MNDTELSAEMKNGKLAGLYFLWGEEDYLKNHRAAQMRDNIVGDDPSLAAFNCFEFTFGDGEVDLGAIRDAMLSPPMMMPKKFVSVSFAALDSLKDKDKTALLELLKSFSPEELADTVFVMRATAEGFDAGTAKRPSSFLNQAMKFMKCVEFPYQTDGRLTRWMERHFAEYGLIAEPGVCTQILATAGKSMYRLSGELAKTAAYAAARYDCGAPSPYADGRRTVTLADVAACVARTEEDDAFGLANKILAGDTGGALAALNIKKNKREEPVYVLAQITRVFSDLATAALFIADGREKGDYAKSMKMNDYRAGLYYRAASQGSPARFAAAMEACVNADRQMKSGAMGYAPIERLICSQASGAVSAGGQR